MKKLFLLIILMFVAVNLSGQTATTPTSGTGTASDPYQIATWENLYWIRTNTSLWDKNFIQTADITFPVEINTWDGNQGWYPLGNFNKFTGTYDGNHKSINGLFINRPSTDGVGLFGETYLASIKNLKLLNTTITGNMFTGTLVGSNNQTDIINCSSEGTLIGDDFIGGLIGNSIESKVKDCSSSVSVTSDNSMGTAAGGLIGHNGDGPVINCSSTGDVDSYMMVGGLVGINTDATISACYCLGNVTGDTYVGGFVGSNGHSGTIENCYTTCEVYGENSVGGFAGCNSESLIQNCFSKGNVTCETSYAGRAAAGFVGFMDQATITNCYSTDSVRFTDIADPTDKGFIGEINSDGPSTMNGNFWDIDSSGQLSTIDGAQGQSTDAMKSSTIFLNAGWDLNSIWGMCDTINDGYPHLYFQSPLPRIMINSVANVAEGSANITGDLIHPGDPKAYKYGFCWNTEGDLSFKDEHNELGTADSSGIFQTTISGLIPNAYYYIRAYIISDLGMTYSKTINFTSYQLPVIDNLEITSIDSTTCVINAEATTLGYPRPSMHGFCWNTEGDPSISDTEKKLGILNSAGVFSANIRNLTPGTNYYIRAYATNKAGTTYSDVLSFTIQETAISDDIPATYALSQNYPNPFNPSTTIRYQLSADSDVKLIIYDMNGKEITSIVNEYKSAGYYSIDWNASEYGSGVYFYRLCADNFVEIKKMVLIK